MPHPNQKLLFLVTEDWYFISHRLPMARAARAAGFDVVVATRIKDHAEDIENAGFRAISWSLRRKSLNPVRELRSLVELIGILRTERPNVVHSFGLKPVLHGAIAARFAKVGLAVATFPGFGFLATSRSLPVRFARPAIKRLLRWLLDHPNTVLVLQNPDDIAFFADSGIIRRAPIECVRGSGVDIEHFLPLPLPLDAPLTFAYVGRMIEDKGVSGLVAAHRILRERGLDCRLLLCGMPDEGNLLSISWRQIDEWARIPGIEWRKHVDDVREIWAESHLAVLGSKREGLPLSLLEAAACARALVGTDVPGNREIILEGQNGRLVPYGDAAMMATALAELGDDKALLARYGAESRKLVEREFSAAIVGREIVEVYRGRGAKS